MTHDFDIRPLGPGDREAWAPLWRAYLAFYETTRDASVFDATFARLVDADAADMAGWLGWRGDEAVGLVHRIAHRHCWSVEDVTYLQDLYVAPSARGTGLAEALIRTVYAEADENGRGSVYWMTQEANSRARALYDRIAVKTPFIKYARG